MRAIFAAAAILGLVSGGSTASAQTPNADREARIAAHRERIQEVLRIDQHVNNADARTSAAPTFPIGALSPTNFDEQIVPLLEQAGASKDQAARLRDLNSRLWDMRTLKKVVGPDLEAMLNIRAEQQKVLTPAQSEAFKRLCQEQMRARRMEADSVLSTGPSGLRMPPGPGSR